MQLFMVFRNNNIDNAIWVSAEHEGVALWEASQVTGIDKFEMIDDGYQALPVPTNTHNGFEVKVKKVKSQKVTA